MPVIDASIAVKWFIEESDSPLAISLRDAHIYRQRPLVIPDLLIYEVSNVLLHNPRFTENEVLRAVRTIYDLQIEIVVPTEELIQEAIRLATGHIS